MNQLFHKKDTFLNLLYFEKRIMYLNKKTFNSAAVLPSLIIFDTFIIT